MNKNNEDKSYTKIEPSLYQIRRASLFGILSFVVASCAPRLIEQTELSTPEFDPVGTTTLIPTGTNGPESSPIPENTPIHITSNYFEIGNTNKIKLNEPFTVNVPLETAIALSWGEEKNFHMDLPKITTTPYWDLDVLEEYDLNGADNSLGNMYIITQSDRQNSNGGERHFLIRVHSGNRSSVGKAVYMAGYVESIGKTNDLIGKTLNFNFSGTNATGKIIYVTNIATTDFYDPKNWSDPSFEPIMYSKLDSLKIPKDDPLKFYLTFATCNFAEPGRPSLEETLESLNSNEKFSAIHTLMTIEFTLP